MKLFGDGYIDCIAITGCETENRCNESECIAKDCADVCGGNHEDEFACYDLNEGFLITILQCGTQDDCP